MDTSPSPDLTPNTFSEAPDVPLEPMPPQSVSLSFRMSRYIVALVDAEVRRARQRTPGVTFSRGDVVRYCVLAILDAKKPPKIKEKCK